MSLKSQPDRPAVVVPAPPAWGVLAEPGEPVSSIRFECAHGAYSYPYHVIARWVLQPGTEETLEIQAGRDRVVVRGTALEPVRDALEAVRLRVLRITPARYSSARTGTFVSALEVISPTD